MSNGKEKPGDLLPHEKAEVELIKDFIGLRKQELEVRQHRTEVRAKHQDNQKEVALASIEAQRKDRQEIRNASQSESTKTKWFVIALVVILAVFSGFLVWLGYVSLAEKIITYLLAAVLGVAGGYGYAIKTIGTTQE